MNRRLVISILAMILVLYFCIGNRGITNRTPVDDPAALVYPSFFMHLHEDLGYCLVAALIHGEALTFPVA